MENPGAQTVIWEVPVSEQLTENRDQLLCPDVTNINGHMIKGAATVRVRVSYHFLSVCVLAS